MTWLGKRPIGRAIAGSLIRQYPARGFGNPEMNKEWHAAHKLGRHASMDDRMAWHLKHAANCGCRKVPQSIMRELENRGLVLPSPDHLK
jgi:hypothetical protein